jgi:hypothetical protein
VISLARSWRVKKGCRDNGLEWPRMDIRNQISEISDQETAASGRRPATGE